jgi:hypothetical protein
VFICGSTPFPEQRLPATKNAAGRKTKIGKTNPALGGCGVIRAYEAASCRGGDTARLT